MLKPLLQLFGAQTADRIVVKQIPTDLSAKNKS